MTPRPTPRRPFARFTLPALLAAMATLALAPAARADLFITTYESGLVGKYAESGSPINANLITGFGFQNSWGIAADSTHIYVVNSAQAKVSKYTHSGQLVNSSLVSGLYGAIGIAVQGSDLYISSNGGVGKYSTNGAVINASLVPASASQAWGIAVSGMDLYVANFLDGTVGKYSTSGQVINAALINNGGFATASAVAVGGNNLYVANWSEGTIGRYTTSGTVINSALLSIGPCSALAVDGSNLWAISTGGGVGKYALDGTPLQPLFGVPSQALGIAITVPEPASLALVALGALPLLIRRRPSQLTN